MSIAAIYFIYSSNF